MYILLDFCQKSNVLELINFILKALRLVCIIVPIFLIVLITIDFIKCVVSGNQEEIKKIGGIIIKRIIYCALIFFVPMIVNLIVNVLGDLGVDYMECIQNATDEKISYYKQLEEKEGSTLNPVVSPSSSSKPSTGSGNSSTGTSNNSSNSSSNTKEKDVSFKITKDSIVIGHYKNTVNKYTIVLKGNGKTLNNKNYKFESSNPAIASVTSKGVVKGKFGGKATITVTSKKDSSNKQKVSVLVVHTLYTRVKLNKTVTGESAKTGNKVKLKSGTTGLFNGIGPNTSPNGYLLGDTIKVNGDYIEVDASNVSPYKYYASDIYSKEDVEDFVNEFGFSSSTKYLFWSNAGTGMEYMFKGKKGKWKLYKQFYINVGDAAQIIHSDGSARTGVHFNMFLADHGNLSDPKNIVNGIPVIYKSYLTAPTRRTNPWHAGGSKTRLPASHGCTRFLNEDMKYINSIYDKIKNSTLLDF